MSLQNTNSKTTECHFSTNPFSQHKDVIHQYDKHFLNEKFDAMKEIDFDKTEHHPKHSTLQLSNTVVYTNFYETEREPSELLNLLS